MLVDPMTPVKNIPATAEIHVDRRENGVLAFTYSAGKTTAEDVLKFVRASGVSIRDVKTEQADLEDVFLSLTKSI